MFWTRMFQSTSKFTKGANTNVYSCVSSVQLLLRIWSRDDCIEEAVKVLRRTKQQHEKKTDYFNRFENVHSRAKVYLPELHQLIFFVDVLDVAVRNRCSVYFRTNKRSRFLNLLENAKSETCVFCAVNMRDPSWSTTVLMHREGRGRPFLENS